MLSFRCNQAVPAQKQLTIYSPPNILMVQLKRFDMMRGGLKINKPITFTEEFDLKSALSAESKARHANIHVRAAY